MPAASAGVGAMSWVRGGSGEVTDTKRAGGALVAKRPGNFGLSHLAVMLWAMPRTAKLDGVADVLGEQLGLVTRGQLLALGVTDRVMQYRVRAGGPWQALLPGVYLGVSGEPNLLQK